MTPIPHLMMIGFFEMVIVCVVAAAVTIGGLMALSMILKRPGLNRNSRHRQDEETRLIQELHQGLSRMEKRIESLETIILDQERNPKEPRP